MGTVERQKQPRRRRVRSVMEDDSGRRIESEREVIVTGPEAEANTLLARLAPVFAQHVAFYKEYYGLTPEAVKAKLEEGDKIEPETVMATPPPQVQWWHLSALANMDLKLALEIWEKVKQAAREELACGARTSDAVFPNASPFERARYFALREEMADDWNPQNGIEHALIDMLAMSFSLYLHWTEVTHSWATRAVERLHGSSRKSPVRGEQTWESPRLTEAEAIEHAHRLADGYNRTFLRTLRQLRDLRRYTPNLTIQNAGQVNIGAQQVNAAQIQGGNPV